MMLVSLLGLAACGTRAGFSDPRPEPRSEEERAIEQAVQAVYAAYSFEGGDPPRTESIRSISLPTRGSGP